MSEFNPLQTWIDNDKELKQLLESITMAYEDISLQAKDGFYKISSAFNVPKYPDELSDVHYQIAERNGFDNPTCVFEEFAKIKYAYPDDDIRGTVLMAIYNTKHQYQFDISECAKKHFRKVPREYSVVFIGSDIDGYLYFPKPDESWVELNARSMCRISSR